MTRQKTFGLLLVPAVSAALLTLGCGGSDPSRVCVDAQGRRVSDGECDDNRPGGHPFTHWYYISHGGSVPAMGGTAGSGSGISGASNPAGVSRGGFGSSAHGASAAGE